MTVSAISIANARGYDIVTDSTECHFAVAMLDERAVIQQLLDNVSARKERYLEMSRDVV